MPAKVQLAIAHILSEFETQLVAQLLPEVSHVPQRWFARSRELKTRSKNSKLLHLWYRLRRTGGARRRSEQPMTSRGFRVMS